MFDTLDAILATAAVILGLALIVQAIQQILKQFFDLKSEYMRVVLLAQFKRLDPQADGTLTSLEQNLAVNWTRVTTLAKQAGLFAHGIVNELEARLNTFGFRNLHLLESLTAKEFGEIVSGVSSIEKLTAEQRAKILTGIDRWFDLCKRAFQETYERRMRPWAFWISAVVVVGVNANLFEIYGEFARSKVLRESDVALSKQFLTVSKEDLLRQYSESADTSAVVSDSIRIEIMRTKALQIRSLLDEQAFQMLRWSESRVSAMKHSYSFWNYIALLLGWLATTLLVSLGAPFWYDFLKGVTGWKDKLKNATRESRGR